MQSFTMQVSEAIPYLHTSGSAVLEIAPDVDDTERTARIAAKACERILGSTVDYAISGRIVLLVAPFSGGDES